MTVIYSAQIEAPEAKKKSTMLPLLVVLFIISYAILTLLVVEQGRIIESQRSLLRELLKDSTELANLKGKLIHDKAAREKVSPRAQRQDPATESPNARAESGIDSHGSGKETRQRGKSRTMKNVPDKPASDLQDVRRSTRVI